jgi:hypothetical protein
MRIYLIMNFQNPERAMYFRIFTIKALIHVLVIKEGKMGNFTFAP